MKSGAACLVSRPNNATSSGPARSLLANVISLIFSASKDALIFYAPIVPMSS